MPHSVDPRSPRDRLRQIEDELTEHRQHRDAEFAVVEEVEEVEEVDVEEVDAEDLQVGGDMSAEAWEAQMAQVEGLNSMYQLEEETDADQG